VKEIRREYDRYPEPKPDDIVELIVEDLLTNWENSEDSLEVFVPLVPDSPVEW
jgi:hypothetical protein